LLIYLSVVGAGVKARLAFFFATTQLPIYLTPRLIDMIISYARARKPS
jgi:BASS family bile acid:Na+ symporter